MPTRIGKSVRQHMAERLARDPEFAEAMAETRIEGELALEVVRLRELRGMSQYDLAEATGIKQPMINRIERGAQNPTVPTLKKLAVALKATIQINAAGIELRPDPPEYALWAHTPSLVPTLELASRHPELVELLPGRWSETPGFIIGGQAAIPGVAEPRMFRVASAQPTGQTLTRLVVDDNLLSSPASLVVQDAHELRRSSFIQPVA